MQGKLQRIRQACSPLSYCFVPHKQLLLLSLLTAITSQGFAQSPLNDRDAQEILRQQERERQLREQFNQSPDVRLLQKPAVEREQLPATESPCFDIREIILKDKSGVFQWALSAANPQEDPATGRCLGSQGINLTMKRIQDAIIARGYITTRVLAEPQDLNSGTLTLTVIPGRIRAIRIKEGSDSRVNLWNAIPARPGDLLNLRDIEQGLENLKRVPTAEADIQIEPADQPGESDLVVTWKQAFPLRLSFSVDDSGSKATGKYIGNVTLSADHLFALNDLFYVNHNTDLGGGDPGNRGTEGYSAHYSVPFGYWLLSLSSNKNDYHQTVAGINQAYVYSGTSKNHDIKLSRIVYRDAVRKTSLSLRGYYKTSNNYIDDTEIEVQRRRMAGWEAGIAHREFIGSATVDANLAYRKGTGAIKALRAPEENFDEGTSRPRIVTADTQLNLPFKIADQNLRYSGTLRAQWNNTPLIPQDRFSIGGRYTVRGFDGEMILSAERGWLFRNDIGIALGQSGQELYIGLDTGKVDGPTSELLVGKSLTGGVIGLRGAWWKTSYDIFVGTPIKYPEYFHVDHLVTGFNFNIQF